MGPNQQVSFRPSDDEAFQWILKKVFMNKTQNPRILEVPWISSLI
jgi:hypothetical protein